MSDAASNASPDATQVARTPSGRLKALGLDVPKTLPQALEVVEDLAVVAVEHDSCPAWCEECGVWERPRTCPQCSGSGCGPGTASGAFDPCDSCAGDGRAHQGPSALVEQARADVLALVLAEIEAHIMARPEPGEHSPGDHGAVRALDALRSAVSAPGFARPAPA